MGRPLLLLLLIGLLDFEQAQAQIGKRIQECPLSNMFKCQDGPCIPLAKRCNDERNCQDGSDEFDCDKYLCKKPDYFRCDNKHCISAAFICDKENDCGDFSDEKNCTNYKHEVKQNCTSEQWMCNDMLCIPLEWVCNGEPDCLDGSDETTACTLDMKCDGFKCKNGHCIVKEWQCDGSSDCPDNSDEENCTHNVNPKDCTVDNRKYLCKDNTTCIDLKLMCDGTPQCPDKSDEGPKCTTKDNSCKTHSCSHECVETPNGPLCLCPTGYHQLSEKLCADINECETYGICDQKCHNSEGSYNCYCDGHYKLQSDNRTCRAEIGGEGFILFSTKKEIRAYTLTSQNYFLIASNLKQAVGVAHYGDHVYWTDIFSESEAIVRSDRNGHDRELLVTSGLQAPEDLTIDWYTGNIYFTDADMQHIGVCTNDGAHCTVIVNEDIHKPRSIVLNVHEGEMYWSDWGKRPEIARSFMDGSAAISFISNNIHWPNGLVIDYPNDRLYWVDAKLMTIESIHLDGTGRRIILEGIVKHPYSIGIFEDKLYWSDWATHSIQSCDKFTGKNHHTLIKETKEYIYGLHVYQQYTKNHSHNPCDGSFCSHICLLKGHSYTCACTEEQTLAADKHTCIETKKKKVLVVGAGNMMITVHHQSLGKHNLNALPVSFMEIQAMTYDSISGSVIVFDKVQKKIVTVDLDTNIKKTLLEKSIGDITSMDFDYYSNTLYWCDKELQTVEVLSLTTMHRTVILQNLDGEIPLSLALVPDHGIMFVAFSKSTKGVHIDRMHMDGRKGRTHVIEQGLMGPTINMAYDPLMSRIFFSDSHTGNIESTSVDGDDRHAFRSLLTEPVSLAIMGHDIFWTNHNSRKLFWGDILSSTSTKKIILNLSQKVQNMHLVGITGVRTDKHECTKNNGNCSHICLQSNKDIQCMCPLGQSLKSDNKTCFLPKHCKSNEYKCEHSEICISRNMLCDNKKDCEMGDDEKDCIKKLRCPQGFFECLNGDCILSSKVCDLHFDCRDNSDEENCDGRQRIAPKVCPFKCGDGNCISKKFICDGMLDCSDGSDEEKCHKNSCADNEFRCNSGNCIPKTWECDREIDCADKSDEHEFCGFSTCAPDKFSCANGRCIGKSLACNFVDDCGDFSDEILCSNETSHCHLFEFLCEKNSSKCLPLTAKCNGTAECPQGEDEMNCCLSNEFACLNRKCILSSWVCDHVDDCGDKSDENPALCDEHHFDHHDFTAEQKKTVQVPCDDGFRCKTGHCIGVKLVCDGVENCYDGSDEHGTCESACDVNNNPCSDVCIKTPNGPKCACKDGYRLKGDSQSCTDIDECQTDIEACSQICANTIGSFSCSCYEGYMLRADKKSCKALGAPMGILFTSNSHIYALHPTENALDVIFTEETPRIADFAILLRGYIYYAPDMMGTIYRLSLVNHTKEYVTGIGNPQKLAIDWVTENIYFVDVKPNKKIFKVCHLQEKKCAKILELNTNSQITSFVVDSFNKYIFYSKTTWWLFNSPTSVIYKCNLDGSKVTELVKKDIGHISGLTFDHHKKILYFSDQHNGFIHSVNYDGANRFSVLQNQYVRNPIGLDLFEDHIYYLTPRGILMQCKIYGQDRLCNSLQLSGYNTDMFLLVQESKQPQMKNVCDGHNCTHLCIQSEVGVRCVCEDGKVIHEGYKCEVSTVRSANDEELPSFKIHPSIGEQSTTHSGSIIAGVIIAMIIVLLALGLYYYMYRKSNRSGKLDISLRFQNPAYGVLSHENASSNNALQPGKHEYANPVHINNQEMQSTANVVLQKAKQNPFVLTDAHDGDPESADHYDGGKLIKI